MIFYHDGSGLATVAINKKARDKPGPLTVDLRHCDLKFSHSTEYHTKPGKDTDYRNSSLVHGHYC